MGSVRGRASGFTMIELMLVLAVLGVMFSLAAVVLPSRTEAQLQQETARLVSVLAALQREAMLQASPAGLRISARGYEPLSLNSESLEWEHAQGRLLAPRQLVERGLVLRVQRSSDAAVRGGEDWPAVVFDAAGIGEPFVLTLAAEGADTAMIVRGDGVNRAVWQ